MKGGARMSVLLAMVASGWVGTSHARAWVEMAAAANVNAAVEAAARRVAANSEGLLKNPSSFVVVRQGAVADEETSGAFRISMPGMVSGESEEGRLSGMVAVPANARAGDPAYAAAEVESEEVWYDDEPVVHGPYGMVFAEGVTLGYTTLKRHGHDERRRDLWRQERRDRVETPEFGSGDVHRSAQLKFAEAAQPRLAEEEAGFRRAQLGFHRATLTPGGMRGGDGLRHERAPSSRGRQRTNW